MDSITHIALGACMGEAFAGKQLGRKAMLWGALAQSIPDIDFLASFWMDTASNLLAHRGFTHSFLFCLISGLILALLCSIGALIYGVQSVRWVLAKDAGNARMQEIAAALPPDRVGHLAENMVDAADARRGGQ